MINLDHTCHTVLEVRQTRTDLFELVLDRNDLAFSVGDCVALYSGDNKSRPYSIASGEREKVLRFLIRRIDRGEVSPWLAARSPGDTVRLTPPFGWFRPGQDRGADRFVFLATGTGIAPFLAYMETFEKPPLACLYGVRHTDDAIGFKSLSRYCPTRLAVSREPAGIHHQGRITDLLPTLPLDPGTHYYSCGLESMINDVAAWLDRNGVARAKIHSEVFFHG